MGLPEEIAEKSPFELSGGQMRRAAIAGVIAMRPEMLVLDEPAAGLDPMGREDMLALVRSFHQAGTSIVMISHSMDDVARLAQRIIVMDQGQVALDGPAEEVFQDADRLNQMDLDVPQVCKLSLRLREEGFDFPLCYRMEDAEKALAALLKGGKPHA